MWLIFTKNRIGNPKIKTNNNKNIRNKMERDKYGKWLECRDLIEAIAGSADYLRNIERLRYIPEANAHLVKQGLEEIKRRSEKVLTIMHDVESFLFPSKNGGGILPKIKQEKICSMMEELNRKISFIENLHISSSCPLLPPEDRQKTEMEIAFMLNLLRLDSLSLIEFQQSSYKEAMKN